MKIKTSKIAWPQMPPYEWEAVGWAMTLGLLIGYILLIITGGWAIGLIIRVPAAVASAMVFATIAVFVRKRVVVEVWATWSAGAAVIGLMIWWHRMMGGTLTGLLMLGTAIMALLRVLLAICFIWWGPDD